MFVDQNQRFASDRSGRRPIEIEFVEIDIECRFKAMDINCLSIELEVDCVRNRVSNKAEVEDQGFETPVHVKEHAETEFAAHQQKYPMSFNI